MRGITCQRTCLREVEIAPQCITLPDLGGPQSPARKYNV